MRRPLQVDEALTLEMAGLPLKQGIALMAADVHPPLILLLVRPFEALHVPDVVVRLIMVAFGVASVALVYAIVSLWAGRRAALIAMALSAVMPTVVFYDTWVRMYAPFSTVELLGWWLLSLVVVRDDLSAAARRAAWIGWALASAAAAYLQYLAWFTLAAQLVWIALRHRRASLKAVAGAGAAVILWLPQMPVFIHQLSVGGQSWPWGLAHPGPAIFRIPGEALLHPETDLWLDPVHTIALAGVVAVLAAVFFFSRGTALPWLGLPSALVVASSLAAHESLYLDRYYLLLAYAVCAWAGVALERLARIRSGALAAAGIVAAVAAFGIVRALDPYYYTADWPAIWTSVLRNASSREDVIVAEQPSSLLVLKRLAANRTVPEIGVDGGGPVAAAKVDAIKAYQRVFLVLFEASAVDPNGDLIRDLDRYYRIERVDRFERATSGETVTIAVLDRR